MTFMQSSKRYFSIVFAALFMLTSLVSIQAQAAMVGTDEVIAQQQLNVDRAELKGMLDDQSVQDKLASMGVSPDQVDQRIDSLTADELAYFNTQLDEAPAGAGVVGIIVLFLVIFVITDMLCATDVYSFVNCINR
ncbi:MAG: PA2779 family protein [Pseudomonas neustonica]|nr:MULTISPECIES: PA2779 family protein [Pseudomonas]|tara:strand:- start:2335 stop:2739 length:405 start_codon:yes stop_codon:yes gene_type:complete